MVSKDHEDEPHELAQALREKLIKANLSRDQVERLKPPSLTKRDHCDLPPYQPGSYRKQCEEARKRLEKLENQCLPAFVPKHVQDKYLNEFYKLKAQGKLSHLTTEMMEKLEKEIKASAADVKKHAELEAFLLSLNKQVDDPEYQQSLETQGADFLGADTTQENQGKNKEKKRSIVKVRTHDGSLVPCFVVFESSVLCDTSLHHHTDNVGPRERKCPIKVPRKAANEVLDALKVVTEYVQYNDLEKYLQDLNVLEQRIRQII